MEKRKPWAQYYTFAWQKSVFFLRTFYCRISCSNLLNAMLVYILLRGTCCSRATASYFINHCGLFNTGFISLPGDESSNQGTSDRILQRTWRRTRRTWRLTFQPQQMKGLRIWHLNARSLTCHLKEVKVLTKLWTVFMSLQWAKHSWSPPGINASSPWKTVVKFIAVTGGMTKKGWRSRYVCQRLYSLTLIQLVGLPYWLLFLQIIRQQLITMRPKVSPKSHYDTIKYRSLRTLIRTN